MIQIVGSNKGILAWLDEQHNRHKIEIGEGTYIYNQTHIMYMDDQKQSICVYDEGGRLAARIKKGKNFYPLHLEHHPKLGLCILAYGRDDGEWRDMYIAFRSDTFVKIPIKKKTKETVKET